MDSYKTGEGEAPGRFDFLGGVAHSEEGPLLAVPTLTKLKVKVTALEDASLAFFSSEEESFEMGAQRLDFAFLPDVSFEEIQGKLDELGVPGWVRNPLGCLIVLHRHHRFDLEPGYNFRVRSELPMEMGLASGAALLVATLRALAQLHAVELSEDTLLAMAQETREHILKTPSEAAEFRMAISGESSLRLPEGVMMAGWLNPDDHFTARQDGQMAPALAKEEHQRCERALALFRKSSEQSTDVAHRLCEQIGATMFESHVALAAMGSVDPVAEKQVEQIKTLGVAQGFYGACVNAEGRCVVVLLQEKALSVLKEMAESAQGGAALFSSPTLIV